MEVEPLLDQLQEKALQAALAGGDVLKKYWGKLEQIRHKGEPGNLVTEADEESEERILSLIRRYYPSHGMIAEESGEQTGLSNEWCWVVDPLDGTTNYTHSFPFVSVSIGLLYRGKPIIGIVYNPIFNELFMAATGRGASLNGEKIQVSSTLLLKDSLLATGFPYDRMENFDNNYREFLQMTTVSQGVRRLGSAALDLAYVACGRLDGYWERGLKIWDIAAGVVLVQEAKGCATAYDQTPIDLQSGQVLATNGHIHRALSKSLFSAHP